MDLASIEAFITGVGFPIALCCLLIYFLWKMWLQISIKLDEVTATNGELTATNRELVEVTKNLLKDVDRHIQNINGRVNVVDEKIDKIEDKMDIMLRENINK